MKKIITKLMMALLVSLFMYGAMSCQPVRCATFNNYYHQSDSRNKVFGDPKVRDAERIRKLSKL
jgi:hypothetical protein